MNSQSLARGLAFFSVGLGLAELLAPRPLARAIGVDEENEDLLRFLGLRELGAGIGIMQGNPAAFVWSRVAGDAMDLGLLAAALRSNKSNRPRVIGAIAAVAGVTALDIVGGVLLSRNPAKPTWRIARGDRRGFLREDPAQMRAYADRTMATHESGHLRPEADATRNGASEMYPTRGQQLRAKEDAALGEFEPGD